MSLQRVIGDGLIVQSNNHYNCLTIVDTKTPDDDPDMLHICDWPRFKKVVDEFQDSRGGDI